MSSVEFKVNLHENQRTIFDSNARYKVIAAGRRFGKTWLAAFEILLKHAFLIDNGITWIVSPRYAQTMLMWKRVKRILPREIVADIKEGEKYIELFNGHQIYAKSGDDPDALRGEGLDFVVVDEAAMIKPEVWFEALAPALMDKRGGAMLISTPKGLDHFYDLFNRGDDPAYPEWESFHFTSYDNPYLSKSEIDEMAKDLPPNVYKQEIMAEFLEGVGEVFGLINWHDAPQISMLPPLKPNEFYIAGLDLARKEDYTVHTFFKVIDNGELNVTIEEVFRDRFGGEWESQFDRIYANQYLFGNPKCFVDIQGLGDVVISNLKLRGIYAEGVGVNSVTKAHIITNLNFFINRDLIKIIRTKDAVEEFTRYTYKTSEAGHVRYSAPKGHHDDIVMAIALAAWGLRSVASLIGGVSNTTEDAKETYYPDEDVVTYDDDDDFEPDDSWWEE